jgi:hypothetical protein
LLRPLLIIGLVFGGLAGAMAFLIAYIEYEGHQLESKAVWLSSLQTGVVAFALFVVIALVAGLVLTLSP